MKRNKLGQRFETMKKREKRMARAKRREKLNHESRDASRAYYRAIKKEKWEAEQRAKHQGEVEPLSETAEVEANG